MNRQIALLLAALALFGLGLYAGQFLPAAADAPGVAAPARKVLFYRNPMNPNITSPTPAKDEMGMDYIPVYEGEDAAAEEAVTVMIAPEVSNNLGVRTEAVTREELARQIETVGYVAYDEDRVSHVHLRASGWIEGLRARSVGTPVKAGDELFRIFSQELVYAQNEFLQTLRSGETGLIASARAKLRSLGISARTIAEVEKTRRAIEHVPVYAHHDGIVTELKAREGMYVGPEMDVMTLADLSSVWLLADVFESQADWVRQGQKAEVSLEFLPGERFNGAVDYVYPDLDPATRTLRVRLRFENRGGMLRPNMYARTTIFASPRNALSVPREALIRTEKETRVILSRGNGRFQPAVVQTGIESGDRVEIRTGVEEGDRVVVSAQFLFDSEASLKAALRRMTAVQQVTATPAISAVGILNSINAAEHTLNLAHEPIAALGWPAMTMDFPVEHGVDLSSFAPGDRVTFDIRRTGETAYVITRMVKETQQ